MAKKSSSKNKKIKGFSIRFMPYSEIKHLDSTQRIRKILDIAFENYILILQGRLRPEEETRLIEDTMAMIGHVKNFRGIELAVISSEERLGIIDKFKNKLVMSLSGGDLGAITIIGPASIVKEIKRDPKKIELMLNK
ncbi:DUF2073 domain-containing protein [archaeon]|nr:DUF2073 domain-containing protein [archaeon]PJC45585.1 MAG: hypothetical protein CO037_00715 [Candidatus Pacearchaeota archaeon CG_4_9_14_0_2_um_filter_30_8]